MSRTRGQLVARTIPPRETKRSERSRDLAPYIGTGRGGQDGSGAEDTPARPSGAFQGAATGPELRPVPGAQIRPATRGMGGATGSFGKPALSRQRKDRVAGAPLSSSPSSCATAERVPLRARRLSLAGREPQGQAWGPAQRGAVTPGRVAGARGVLTCAVAAARREGGVPTAAVLLQELRGSEHMVSGQGSEHTVNRRQRLQPARCWRARLVVKPEGRTCTTVNGPRGPGRPRGPQRPLTGSLASSSKWRQWPRAGLHGASCLRLGPGHGDGHGGPPGAGWPCVVNGAPHPVYSLDPDPRAAHFSSGGPPSGALDPHGRRGRTSPHNRRELPPELSPLKQTGL